MYHKPVLAEESVNALAIRPGGTYVDATFGGGGHSRLILEKMQEGRLYAFDQDKDAIKNAPDDPRFTLIGNNFMYLHNFLRLHGALPVDGILADLGVSSHQIDQADRGFSTRFDGPLDMRMDQMQEKSAWHVVNGYDHGRLSMLLRQYGELNQAGRLAGLIIRQREISAIHTTGQLMQAISRMAPKGRENKFNAKVFQAIRIEVNNEMEALKEFLEQAIKALRPGGRIAVISYHSLEDRLVKHYLRSGREDGVIEKDFYGHTLSPLKPLGKPLVPGNKEMMENPRARSARLRIAEKIIDNG